MGNTDFEPLYFRWRNLTPHLDRRLKNFIKVRGIVLTQPKILLDHTLI